MTNDDSTRAVGYAVGMSSAGSWSSLEVRCLQALRAVAEEGSFGRAAERLGYTQSGVSHQVATLERIVGRRLFDRPGGRRPVELTHAGAILLRHAKAIESHVNAARKDLDQLDAGVVGPLQLGVYQSVGARLLPRILGGFQQAWPDIDVRLTEATTDELLGMVESGQLDVAFTLWPPRPGPFDGMVLMVDPYAAVVARDDPVEGPTMPLASLAGRRLLGLQSCRHARGLEAELEAAGADVAAMLRSDDNGTLQAIAAEGLGTAVMPRLAIDGEDPRVRVLALPGLPKRTIGLAWHRDRVLSGPAEDFIERLRAVTNEPPRRLAEAA